jgi:Tfp pilus assembly protein PilN
MTATVVPPAAPTRPPAGELRFVTVRANLMPDEVLRSRRDVVVRKRVLAGLVVVAILLVGGYGWSWWQTRSANSALAAAQRQGMQLQAQQSQFGPVVKAQEQITSVQTQLHTMMSRDLQWKTMLVALRATEPAGVTLTAVTGTVTPGGTTASVAGLPLGVGTITLTGNAPDKRTVAAYADRLAGVKGLSSPLISSVQASTHPVTFIISAVLTSDAFGGRYSPASTAATSTAGGH